MNKVKEVITILNSQSEDIIFVLRIHLLIENFLEEIIRELIPIKLSGKENFYVKILVVEASNCLPKKIIFSIQKLNSLRNKLSHQLDYKISKNDQESVIKPVNEYQKSINSEQTKEFDATVIYLVGYLNGVVEGVLNKKRSH